MIPLKFLAKTLRFGRKEPIKVQIFRFLMALFQTFDSSPKISPKSYFGRLLLLKVYEILARNLLRSYIS